MPDDLVKRLRASWSLEASQGDNPQLTEMEVKDEPAGICCEAADRIEAAEQALAEANVRKRIFPIMHGDDIPWAVIAPCAAQAVKNHGQILERLAERGGLAPYEAIWVLEGRRIEWTSQKDNGLDRLREIVKERWYIPRLEAAEARAERLAGVLEPLKGPLEGRAKQCLVLTESAVGRAILAALAEEPPR